MHGASAFTMFNHFKQYLITNRTSLCFLSIIPKAYYDDPNPYIKEPENGLERVQCLFRLGNDGKPRKEIISFAQLCFGNAVVVGTYGGFKGARETYDNFITVHQVSRFVSPYEARRKLQDHMIMSIMRKLMFWGIKGFLFSASFLGIVMVISAYRGKDGFIEYIPAGFITGMLTRVFHGFRGMIGGAFVGTVTGVVFGSLINFVSWCGSVNMDEVRDWQKELYLNRQNQIKQYEESSAPPSEQFQLYARKMKLTSPEEEANMVYVAYQPSKLGESEQNNELTQDNESNSSTIDSTETGTALQ